jgi:hypothetical protein
MEINPEFFPEKSYLKFNPDVKKAVENNLFSSGYEHYFFHGRYEKRRVFEGNFNEEYYLSKYKDVRDAIARGDFQCAFQHYCQNGRKEGRVTEAPFCSMTGKYNHSANNPETPLINIVTRTSGRPLSFKMCRDSIVNQTYKNIRHIVSFDNKKDEQYLSGSGAEYYFIDNENLPEDKTPNPMEGNIHGYEFIYNLYFNILFQKVTDGFVLILDDDDVLINNTIIEDMVENIGPETDMLIWQIYLSGKLLTKNFIKPMIGDISSQSVLVHSSLAKLVKWDGWRACDYRYISRCFLEAKNKIFIEKPVVVRANCGGGLRKDAHSITAIILNYRRPDNIPNLINSIRMQNCKIDIALWNNGDWQQFDADLQINSTKNLFCLPRWYVAGMMDSDYVFFIDDDLMLVDNNVITTCVEEEKKHNCIIGYQGVQLAASPPFYTNGNHYKNETTDTCVDVVKGRFMFMKRDLLTNLSLYFKFRKEMAKLPPAEDIYISMMTGGKHILPASLHNMFVDLPELDVGLRQTKDHYKSRNDFVVSMLHESSYCKHFVDTRDELLDLIPKQSIIAELGVFEGKYSEKILKICSPRKLILIDLWHGVCQSGDKDGLNIVKANLDEVFALLSEKYASSNVVSLIRGDVVKELSKFSDNSLDCVYIDARHSYAHVKKNLDVCRNKVRNGGFIIGHDYSIKTVGVIQAVNEFCFKNNLKVAVLTKDACPSYLIVNFK